MIGALVSFYTRFFGFVERIFGRWFMGLSSRFVFSAVLLVYYFNSATTKVGSGLAGFFELQPAAYVQIIPSIMTKYNFDPSTIPVFPWKVITYFGTYAEFALPILIAVGLFTRVAAVGMIVFIAVQTYVDIVFQGATADTIGALFDRIPTSAIADQRTLWVFVLVVIVLRGPGLISLDHLFGRPFLKRYQERKEMAAHQIT